MNTRTGAQRYNKRLDAIWDQARANGALDSGVHALMSTQDEAGRVVKDSKTTWNTELWCNGELQVQKQLTASQVQAITKIIKETK